MKNSKAVKLLTIVGFVILVAIFIAFKTGAFGDRDSDIDHVADEHGNNLADTGKESPSMLSTSKSTIGIDQKVRFPKVDHLKSDSEETKTPEVIFGTWTFTK